MTPKMRIVSNNTTWILGKDAKRVIIETHKTSRNRQKLVSDLAVMVPALIETAFLRDERIYMEVFCW